MMSVKLLTSRFSRITGLFHTLFFPALLCVSLFAANARPGSLPHDRPAAGSVADTTNLEAEICTGQVYTFGAQQLTTSGTYTETFEASDGSDSTVVLVLSVLPAPVTELDVTLCEGETYLFDNKPLTTSGNYTATFSTDAGCDSIVNLTLTFVTEFNVLKDATICQGDTVFFAGNARTQSGIYTDSLKAAGGCDSIVTLRLTVLPVSETVLSVGICTGFNYVFFDDTLDQTGLYTRTLNAANGCDSIVTLKLVVADYFETEVFATICDGETYAFAGENLNVGGVYYDSLQAAGGCDSTLILHLTVLPPNPETNVEATICANQTYEFDGNLLDAEGTYDAVFTDRNGCDSTVVLSLTVLPISTTNISATICAGETFEAGGEVLDETGDYVFVLPAENGCDSTVSVSLTVLPTFETLLNATICTGETYFFEGNDLDESGTYSATYSAENGCDSTIVLHLEILPELFTSLEVTICAGESYAFNGDNLTDAGFYSAVLVSELGCDSIVNLALAVASVEETFIEAAICAGETYEFNGQNLTETGEYVADLISQFGCDSTVTLHLTVFDPIPVTAEFAKICAGETYFFNGQELSEEGAYEAILTAENGCDSVITLQLGIIPVTTVELTASICEGATFEFAGQQLTESGAYTDVQTGSNGCDSTTILTLTVHPLQQSTLDETICPGESYEFDGQNLEDAGTYTAIFPDENGCDSTVTLHLSVLPAQETTLSASICANETYLFDGEALNTAGTYTAVFTGENGCDSTVTLILDVLPTFVTQIEAAICSNETYEFGGEILFATGVYEQMLSAENGCDSTIVLTLQVFPTAATNLSAQICSGAAYLFDGQLLTLSGTYSAMLVTENGCDSLVTLELAVADTLTSSLSATICAGESYLFDGQELTDSGTYDAFFTSEGGCDSVATLTLTVLPNLSTDIEAVICANESYEFDGTTLTDSGTYTALLTTENGCDSTVTLSLTVLPTFVTTEEATICAGETYAFNGDDLTDSGIYTAELVAENGCDSTVTLTLTVLPTFAGTEEATICAGETYAFNGDELTQSGTYTTELVAENGCDSTVTLTLTVLPTFAGTEGATICAGETYAFNGDELTQSGTYTAELVAENGCDSTVTLTLAVLPTFVTTEEATICAGETYEFNGDDLTDSGTYTAELVAENGCDSTITLILTVLPDVLTTVSAQICAGETYAFAGQTLSQPGVYSAILSGQNGCDSTVTLTLAVITVDVAVTLQTNTLTAAATNAAYQWIDCDTNQPIAGAVNASFTPAVTGNYAVQVTQNGCTDQSVCSEVVIVGTDETWAGGAWRIQPNPARGVAWLQLDRALDTAIEIEIFDLSGRLALQQAAPSGSDRLALELHGLSNGLYLVRLTDGAKGSQTKRLVVCGE